MTYILGGAGAFTFLVAVLVGFFAESWFWCMFLVILYILGLFLVQHILKRNQSKLLR